MSGSGDGRPATRLVTTVTALAILAAGVLLPAAARGSGPVVRAAPERSERPQCEATTEEPAEDHEQDDHRGPQTTPPGGATPFVPLAAVGFALSESRCRARLAAFRAPAPIRGPPVTAAIR